MTVGSDRYEATALLGWGIVPNNIVVIGGDQNGWLLINSQRLPVTKNKIISYAIPKPDNIFRIIILGGSTVYGIGASSPSGSLPRQMQSMLESRTSKQIEVINGGVSGSNSSSQMLYLANNLLDYDPDLVVAYDGWNDGQLNHMNIINGAGRLETLEHLRNTQILRDSFTLLGLLKLLAGRFSRELLQPIWSSYIEKTSVFCAARLFGWLPDNKLPEVDIKTLNKSVKLYIDMIQTIKAIANINGAKFAHFLQPVGEVYN